MATDGNFEVKLSDDLKVPCDSPTRRLHMPLSEVLKTSNGDYEHAVHCIIWAPWPNGRVIHDKYPTKAAVLMQVRFDGCLGFAGGLVDVSIKEALGRRPVTVTDVVDDLKRELSEEMNLNENTCLHLTDDDHLFTDVDDVHRLYMHFFALKFTTEKEIRVIERDALNTDDVDEVFGVTRVPLFTMDDGFRGLPIFLNNAFVGNSKEQLLCALKMLDILTEEEISAALHANRKFSEARVAAARSTN